MTDSTRQQAPGYLKVFLMPIVKKDIFYRQFCTPEHVPREPIVKVSQSRRAVRLPPAWLSMRNFHSLFSSLLHLLIAYTIMWLDKYMY